MRGISRLAWALVLALLVTMAVPAVAFAFERRSGNAVSVSDNVSDDLYVFGSSVDVSGNVDGDLVVFGQSITVSGRVSGNVIAAGQTVRVRGPVGGSVRAAGQDVEVADTVGGDAVLAGTTVFVDGSVGRDVVVGGATVSLNGAVARNVVAGAGGMTIASTVGGNVTADATNLTVANGGNVRGNLTYYSDNQAQVSGSIAGRTQHFPARTQQNRTPNANVNLGSLAFVSVLLWIQSLVGMAVFAVLAVIALRGFALVAASRVFMRPLPSVGIGFGVLALAFPVAGLVFFLGLFIGAWWIAFVLLMIVCLLALVGLVIGALALGRWVLERTGMGAPHPIVASLLGLLIIWVIGIVPFVGWLAGFAAVLFGMGAIVVAAYGPPVPAGAAAEPMVAPAPPTTGP